MVPYLGLSAVENVAFGDCCGITWGIGYLGAVLLNNNPSRVAVGQGRDAFLPSPKSGLLELYEECLNLLLKGGIAREPSTRSRDLRNNGFESLQQHFYEVDPGR